RPSCPPRRASRHNSRNCSPTLTCTFLVPNPVPKLAPNPVPNFAPKTKGHSHQAMPYASSMLSSDQPSGLSDRLSPERQNHLKSINRIDPTAKRGNYMQTLQTFFRGPGTGAIVRVSVSASVSASVKNNHTHTSHSHSTSLVP